MITIEEERMSDSFVKYHIRGLPIAAVLHHFTDVDRGDPHDHPWPFQSTILSGGYTEEVFLKSIGASFIERREVGNSFVVPAQRIHRITELHTGDCWTLILPGPEEQKSGFWQFREDGVYHRYWDSQDWIKVEESKPIPTDGFPYS